MEKWWITFVFQRIFVDTSDTDPDSGIRVLSGGDLSHRNEHRQRETGAAPVMLKSISTGAAGSAQMNNVASKALKDDFNPGFFLKHFIKDMSLAEEEAAAVSVKLDVLEDVLQMCKGLEDEGMGDLGTQALIKHYKW